MRLAALTILLILIVTHFVFSLLALFQANRFRNLSQSSPWVIWPYMGLTLLIDVVLMWVFLGIDF